MAGRGAWGILQRTKMSMQAIIESVEREKRAYNSASRSHQVLGVVARLSPDRHHNHGIYCRCRDLHCGRQRRTRLKSLPRLRCIAFGGRDPLAKGTGLGFAWQVEK